MLKRSKDRAAQVLVRGGFLAAAGASSLGAASGQQATVPRGAATPQVLAAAPTVAPAASSSRAPALISEVRAYGPGGAQDSFIEVCSTRDQPLDLSGWSLQFLNAAGRLVTVPIAPDSVLAPRGHILLAGRLYSLSAYARRDALLPGPIASGVRLLDASGHAVDAVGPQMPGSATPEAKGPSPGLSEGRGLPAWAFAPEASSPGAGVAQFSCVRRREAGLLLDTNDNARDWIVVSVSGNVGGRAVRLGAPGPENKGSDRLAIEPRPAEAASATPQAAAFRPASVGSASRVGPGQSGGEAVGDGSRRLAPLRDGASVGPNRSQGTLMLRYKLVNESGRVLRRFRLQVVGATSGSAAAGIADLRLLPLPPALKPGKLTPQAATSTSRASQPGGEAKTGASAPASAASGLATERPILYGELDEPPAQASGGGFNSSLSFEPGPDGIAPGGSVELRILLGVEKPGRYRLALDGGGLSVAFNGHIQARSAQALVADSWASSSWSSRQGTTSASGSGPGSAPNLPGAAQQPGQTAVEQTTLLASITLEGNTEDSDDREPTVADSPLHISSSEIAQAAGTIRLRFMGPINPASVTGGATFEVTINGQQVEGAASVLNPITVQLKMPEGSLRHGDRVTIRWSNLRDPQGRRVSGESGLLLVP